MALRIVLGAIETHANRYNRYIVPLVSLQIDFYLRVFVRVFTSKAEVKKAGLKRSYVFQSKPIGSKRVALRQFKCTKFFFAKKKNEREKT